MENIINPSDLAFVGSVSLYLALITFFHFKGLFAFNCIDGEGITAKEHLSRCGGKDLDLWRSFWQDYRRETAVFLVYGLLCGVGVVWKLCEYLGLVPRASQCTESLSKLAVILEYIAAIVNVLVTIDVLREYIKLAQKGYFKKSFKGRSCVYKLSEIFHLIMRYSLCAFMSTVILYTLLGVWQTIYALIPFLISFYVYLKLSDISGSHKDPPIVK